MKFSKLTDFWRHVVNREWLQKVQSSNGQFLKGAIGRFENLTF